MIIARVRGNVVTTQKAPKMAGRKLLLVEPLGMGKDDAALAPTGRQMVAVDSLGAGEADLVLLTQGSSARMTEGTSDAPVDLVVIGIVDSVSAAGAMVYRKDKG